MTQRTLVLLKPDTVARALVGQILGRYEAKGLRLVAMDLRTIDTEQADAHYAEHVDKAFYPPLRDFVTSGPLVAMVLEGDEAVDIVRALNGATDGRKAAPGLHPRRPVAVQPREPGARLGLAGVGRPRDRAVVPRTGLSP
jgi:nucleoside-diphosphate kinase